ANRALGLPQCGAAIVAERVERADVGERDHLVAPQARAGDEIVERLESFAFALLLEREPLRRAAPVVRAVVAEPAPVVHALEHRRVITPAFRAAVRVSTVIGTAKAVPYMAPG